MVAASDKGTIVGFHVADAVSFYARFRGMMLREFSPELDGMLFRKCNAVHTFFMKIPLDLLFLDTSGKVVFAAEKIPPWRPCIMDRKASAVLEIPAGTIEKNGLKPGDILQFSE